MWPILFLLYSTFLVYVVLSRTICMYNTDTRCPVLVTGIVHIILPGTVDELHSGLRGVWESARVNFGIILDKFR